MAKTETAGSYSWASNAEQERGITAAREAYNAALPEHTETVAATEEGGTSMQKVVQHPDFKATNQDYISFVLSNASDSYARQYPAS